MYKFGERSNDWADGVDSQLWECAEIALSKCKNYDMSVGWKGGLRTAADQQEIYDRGASSKDGTIKLSYHQSGLALDIVPVGLGSQDLDLMVKAKKVAHPGFRQFAKNMFNTWQNMLKAGDARGRLEWGGNWKSFIDLPHWQVMR